MGGSTAHVLHAQLAWQQEFLPQPNAKEEVLPIALLSIVNYRQTCQSRTALPLLRPLHMSMSRISLSLHGWAYQPHTPAWPQVLTPPALVNDTCDDPGSSSIPYNWTVGVEGETVRPELAMLNLDSLLLMRYLVITALLGLTRCQTMLDSTSLHLRRLCPTATRSFMTTL